MEDQVVVNISIFDPISEQIPQIIHSIFVFLDTRSLNLSKKVNKAWYEKVGKFYESKNLLFYNQLFSQTNIDMTHLNDEEINKIKLLLLKALKIQSVIPEHFIDYERMKYHMDYWVSTYQSPSLIDVIRSVFVIIVEPPKMSSWKQIQACFAAYPEFFQENEIRPPGFFEHLEVGPKDLQDPKLFLEMKESQIKALEEIFESMSASDISAMRMNLADNTHFGYCIYLIFDVAKRRFELSGQARKMFDSVFLKITPEKKKELFRLYRHRMESREVFVKFEAINKMFEKKILAITKGIKKKGEELKDLKYRTRRLEEKLGQLVKKYSK